jgi:hypothetical protein
MEELLMWHLVGLLHLVLLLLLQPPSSRNIRVTSLERGVSSSSFVKAGYIVFSASHELMHLFFSFFRNFTWCGARNSGGSV